MLIDPTTEAKAVSKNLKAGQTIQVRGDLGSEIIAIKIPDGAGGWRQLVEKGSNVQLDSDNGQIVTLGNTLIQVAKPITTNAVGVAII